MIPYINYYRKIKSIPTLNITDISIRDLYKQRSNFYFKLGITENDLKKKSILELCPGAGYNAHYLIKQCKIKNILLVDHNPASLAAMKKHLVKYKNVKILNQDVNKFLTKKKYDYTIIENSLSGFRYPKSIFNKLLKFTNYKGVLICTFTDPIGVFSEKLRYLLSLILLEQNKIKDFKKRHLFLTKVFARDLKYLSKNTRPAKKWVLDNLMNEEWMKKKNDFHFLNIVDVLNSKKYLVKSISPNFYFDYGWYKTMKYHSHNKNIITQYKENNMNFLDFETRFNKNIKNLNKYLKIFNQNIQHFEYNKKLSHNQLRLIKIILKNLSNDLAKINPKNKVSLSLNEISKIISNFINGKKINEKTKIFYKFWGIGTQAISIYKL